VLANRRLRIAVTHREPDDGFARKMLGLVQIRVVSKAVGDGLVRGHQIAAPAATGDVQDDLEPNASVETPVKQVSDLSCSDIVIQNRLPMACLHRRTISSLRACLRHS